MIEKEKGYPDFDLEDILKEFGNDPEEQPRKPEEDPTPELSQEESGQLSQNTVRLDEITKAARQVTAVTDDTVAFTPVGQDPDEEPQIILPPEPETEPYSEKWEPEYEQPISDYVPLQPIVFRPKSRLQELKRKLIEGPEKRYYELVEQGLGKLQLAIFANLLVALVSAGTTAIYAAGNVPQERMRLMVFAQLLGLLLSAALGSYQLMEGMADLGKRHFSVNTLLLFSLVACVADGIFCLSQVRVPCCAPFSLNMTMSLWGAYQRRNTEMGQMDTMRKATRLESLVLGEDVYEGKPGFLRGEGQVEDFMDTYGIPSAPERVLGNYALTALFVSIGIGVTAGVLHSPISGIRFFSASLLVAVPATSYITVSRPMAILERRLHKVGTVLCGWQGVKALNKQAAFPLLDTDLFPAGSVKMNGLKFYGSRNPDQVVAYGTAVIVADGSGLAPLFSQLLESRNGYHYEVQALRSYENEGIGGVVNDEAVLAGTLEFMQKMGVEMPQGTRVTQAVYVAVDGVLSGVFALSFGKGKSSSVGLTSLCAYRGLKPVMASGNFMLDEEFIHDQFGVNTRRMAFPARNVRDSIAGKIPDEDTAALALTTREGLASLAYAVTGARALRSATVAGVAIHMLGGILGLLIMLALTVLDAQNLLTPGNLLLYELVWMIPGLLITEWTRSV